MNYLLGGGMYNYLLLDLGFMLLAASLVYCWTRKLNWPAALKGFGVLLVLSLVFDQVIIGLNIVEYDPAQLLGAYIGKAPIEDFAYALVAALLMPALWHKAQREK